MGVKYVVVWTLQRGKLEPPEPADEESQAVCASQDRYAAALAAEQVLWNTGYMPETRRRREVA